MLVAMISKGCLGWIRNSGEGGDIRGLANSSFCCPLWQGNDLSSLASSWSVKLRSVAAVATWQWALGWAYPSVCFSIAMSWFGPSLMLFGILFIKSSGQ
uniref:Uncharacterized protein n=1 Tax=Romanomermis culicivorax TaxID=13658 RepID=A0A915K4R9_ROMCU